ncbi:hypothetical protein MPSEU_000336700 [Mayamaea pseudoterrestris]|nr:hypothetical protein MPSEU_000336700 [Mayamaea pseudoterrestris]
MAEEIILPPPSALHPIPSLTAALRLDNQDQLTELLRTTEHPMLVFGSESLRTLMLRQVLADPNNRQPKKKLDAWNQFTSLPKGLVFNSTDVLSEAPLETGPASTIFYFIQASNPGQTQLTVQKIKEHGKLDHKIVYIPQATAMITKLLSDWNISSMPNVSIHRLQCNYLFPIETDIYSSEYKDALWESAVQGTPSFLITHVAKSLMQLQQVVGPIPRIQSYGPMAEEVLRKLLNLTVDDYFTQSAGSEQDAPTSVLGGQVSALIILDRKVDQVTPMLTPLTYEGLLDHVLKLDCGYVRVAADLIQDKDDDKNAKTNKLDDETKALSTGAPALVAVGLNSADTLYAEVRNQHVEQFGSFLQNQAKALQESHAKFTSTGKKKDLQEIHQFVKNIPMFTQNLKSLTTHIHLAEIVKKTTEDMEFREQWNLERSILEGESAYDQLEDLVAMQYPPWRFLRLLCLQSLCGGGIKSSRYDTMRRDVVQTYGYEFMFVLQNLEKAGLLHRREGLWMDTASPFSSLRSKLHLIHAEVDTVEPDDISYVSSGYAPLSIRIIQMAVKGWQGKDDILKELPGRLVDILQQTPPEDLSAALTRPRPTQSLGTMVESEPSSKKPVLAVYFVGGVTYMELAAMRFLSKRPTFPFHIICCTTKIINGDTLLESLAQ